MTNFKTFMQKQFVNRLLVFFILFVFAIYFTNYYLKTDNKTKLYLTLNNYNLSFFLDIDYFLCNEMLSFESLYKKNNCINKVSLNNKNFKTIYKDNLKFLISNSINYKISNLNKEIKKIIYENKFKLVKNINSKIMFSSPPSFFSLSPNDIISQEFKYIDKLTDIENLKLKKKINLSIDQTISNYILLNKKSFYVPDEFLSKKEKLLVNNLIDFTFDNRNFPKKNVVFLSIYLFHSISNSQDLLESYIKNYKMKFNSTENDLLKKYLIYLTNLKINNFEQYKKIKFVFYLEIYKKIITNQNNFYKLYVFS